MNYKKIVRVADSEDLDKIVESLKKELPDCDVRLFGDGVLVDMNRKLVISVLRKHGLYRNNSVFSRYAETSDPNERSRVYGVKK